MTQPESLSQPLGGPKLTHQDDPPQLANDRQLVALLSDLIMMHMDDTVGEVLYMLGQHKLSMPQLVTLHTLYHRGELSVSELAHELQLSLAATSHLIDRLVRRGMLTRHEHSTDRRHKQVRVTASGAALVESLVQLKTRALAREVQCMPPDLRVRLRHLLEEVAASVRQADSTP
ncbi:MAG: MarR family transcriptional regulator [Chloroflexaceae bacterium]|nr:MarR family transcriptional regulator [Chloroflexaceae bacterium]